jgi:hypothetical protein
MSPNKEITVPTEILSGTVLPESLINVLGVVYVHRKTSDGGDLYLTRFGLPHARFLEIDNWYEKKWFAKHRERLQGTSAVYKVPTKKIDGRHLELVVKNCRVGEDVPVQTRTLQEFINAEFNSPWEEFALVMELREGKYGPADLHIKTQEPLAIYVPPERMQLWQSGRSKAKINRINDRHAGIDLDILRQYKLVYGWIRGENVVDTFRVLGLRDEPLKEQLIPANAKVIADLGKKGYAVADMKPEHIIIEERELDEIRAVAAPTPALTAEAQLALVRKLVDDGRYAMIDYELLLRTPPHEDEVNYARRHSYLDDQRDRFIATPLSPYLKSMEVFGVPYICGHVESTGGRLWVVGRNERLFDYFLPERWRKTPCWRLSANNEIYYTFTKDHIHLVWKTSRVGEMPTVDPGDPNAFQIEAHGFNSPFEEFAIAQDLNKKGIPTVYVRAIYMTGSDKLEPSSDKRRFESHARLKTRDGDRVMRPDRNYISLRGYFNGPDGWVAQQNGKLCKPVNLFSALANGIISAAVYQRLFDDVQQKLKGAGYDGALLKSNDLVMAVDPDGKVLSNDHGEPEIRICNFELLRRL